MAGYGSSAVHAYPLRTRDDERGLVVTDRNRLSGRNRKHADSFEGGRCRVHRHRAVALRLEDRNRYQIGECTVAAAWVRADDGLQLDHLPR